MDALRPAIERALSETLGSSVRLGVGAQILDAMPDGYATVVRFGVDAAGHAPPSVIVKRPGNWAPYDPDSTESTAWGLLNEWAALELLNGADAAVAPRLLAADRANGFLVLEDLGDGDGIADLLLGDDATAARDGLTAFMSTLGRMHAVTAGRADDYEELRRSLGPLPEVDRYFAFGSFIPSFATACARLGVDLAGRARHEADAVVASMSDPGPFASYVHGDACPDNTRVVDGRVVLIDFEVGGVRHAFVDGAYAGAPFPTCWCVNRIPSDVVDEMEHAYRSQLTSAMPGTRDDAVFGDAMLCAMAFWALAVTGWHAERALEADELMHRGVHTRRQGLRLRWENFVSRAEQRDALPALTEFGRRTLRRLDVLWPDAVQLARYPAFR
jgi:hypothetical protein